jgi:oligosaccharide repeat unit polymerase
MTFLTSAFIAGLAFLNWRYAKSLVFPPVVFCLVWAGILMGLVLSGDTFYQLGFATMAICSLGCLSFSVGGIALNPACRPGTFKRWHPRSPLEDQWTLRTIDILFVAFICLYPIYWLRLAAIGHGSVGIELLRSVRTEMVEGDLGNAAGLGFFRYVMSALIVITLIVTTETCRLRLSKSRLFLWIILGMAYNVPTGSRLSSLIVLFGVLAIFAFVQSRIPILPAVSIGLAVAVIFSVAAVALGKGGNLNESPLENAESVARSLQVYVLGGIIACDQTLQKPPNLPREARSLRFFYAVADVLGRSESEASTLLPYVNTPSETNVYSVYYGYLRDFGWAGVSALFLCLGAALAGVYRAAARGRPEAVTLLGLTSAYLVLTCEGDPFIAGLSACIQSAALVIVLYNLVPLLRWCNVGFSSSPKMEEG